MNVIFDAIDGVGKSIDLADDSSEIGVKTGLPNRIDVRRSILRAEDEMIMKGCVRGWHSSSLRAPPGRASYFASFRGRRSAIADLAPGYLLLALRAKLLEIS